MSKLTTIEGSFCLLDKQMRRKHDPRRIELRTIRPKSTK